MPTKRKSGRRPTTKRVPTKREAKGKAVKADFDGLREMLFEEINLLRTNQISTSRARVVSNLAKRIIEAATLDLFAQNLLNSNNKNQLKSEASQLKRLMSNNVQE